MPRGSLRRRVARFQCDRRMRGHQTRLTFASVPPERTHRARSGRQTQIGDSGGLPLRARRSTEKYREKKAGQRMLIEKTRAKITLLFPHELPCVLFSDLLTVPLRELCGKPHSCSVVKQSPKPSVNGLGELFNQLSADDSR